MVGGGVLAVSGKERVISCCRVPGVRAAVAGCVAFGCAAWPGAGTTWTRTAVPAVSAPILAVIEMVVAPGVVPQRIPHTEAFPWLSAITSSAGLPLANRPVTPSAGSRKLTFAFGMGEPLMSTMRTVAPV